MEKKPSDEHMPYEGTENAEWTHEDYLEFFVRGLQLWNETPRNRAEIENIE